MHRCAECGRRRVNVTVVAGRDLCPECARVERRVANLKAALAAIVETVEDWKWVLDDD